MQQRRSIVTAWVDDHTWLDITCKAAAATTGHLVVVCGMATA